MNLVTSVSRNWVGFTTLYATEVAEASALAAWADIDDDYVFFDWSTDTKMLDQSTQSTTKAAQLAENNYNCLAMVYGTAQDAAAFLAVGASIDWSAIQELKPGSQNRLPELRLPFSATRWLKRWMISKSTMSAHLQHVMQSSTSLTVAVFSEFINGLMPFTA